MGRDSINWFESILKNLTIFTLLIYGYDPFAIYKDTHRRRSESLKFYLRPELAIADTGRPHKRRQRVRALLKVLFVATLVRFTMVCLVQIANYQASTFRKIRSAQGEEILIAIIEDTVLIILLKQWRLYYWFDNVLADFPRIMFSVYIVLLVSLLYSVYYLPEYYASQEPLDALDLRMALDPEQERKRLDLLVEDKTDQFLLGMELYRREIMRLDQHACRNCPTAASDGRANGLVVAEQLARLCQLKCDHSLRPQHYHLGCDRFWRRIKALSLLISTTGCALGGTVQAYVLLWTIDLKCKLRLIDPCSMFRALSASELYSLAEIGAAIAWVGVIMLTMIIIVAAVLDAQQMATQETRVDMCQLIDALRLVNHGSGSSSGRGRRRRRPSENAREADALRQHLDGALLRSLLKSRIYLDETRSRARFASKQVSAYVVLYGTGIPLAILTVKMDGPDIEALRLYVMAFMWWGANLILFLSAHQCANLVKLERLCWSLVAQLADLRRDKENVGAKLFLSPLESGWLKLIKGDSWSDKRNIVQPFGISLTHRRILQLNFYLFSLAAFVMR